MRIALMTAGSTGDVAPFTGLGHGLQRAGHDVTLVTHARFATMVAAAGLDFYALPLDMYEESISERGQALRHGTTAAGTLTRIISFARPLLRQLVDDLLKAAQSSDVLVLSSTLAPMGHTIAEGLGLPSMGAYLQPLDPTGDFPPVFGTRSLGRTGNRLAGHIVNAVVEAIFADTSAAVRARLGLPRTSSRAARRCRERQDWPIHHGFSPLVVPRPADWRPGLTVGGYWWPHHTAEPLPERLTDFLAAGPPPVFVGLGSATVPDPERLSATVVAALRAAGLRGVIQHGWAGLHAEDDDMFTIDEVPHALLFPRMAAVVHHAGAGTTAAGLRAGVPAVPVPTQLDAAFWSARLAAMGVSPGAVPLRRLTATDLTAALVRVTADPSYRGRAQQMAIRIRGEDGVRPVLSTVESMAS